MYHVPISWRQVDWHTFYLYFSEMLEEIITWTIEIKESNSTI